jgi:hypothetical protein
MVPDEDLDASGNRYVSADRHVTRPRPRLHAPAIAVGSDLDAMVLAEDLSEGKRIELPSLKVRQEWDAQGAEKRPAIESK